MIVNQKLHKKYNWLITQIPADFLKNFYTLYKTRDVWKKPFV